MINYIWGAMILVGIILGVFNGRLAEVTQAAVVGGKDAVTVCITMLGVVSMWQGIMKIAEKGGLISSLSNALSPVLDRLFTDIPKNHPAKRYIALNLIANMLGLGWAATPAGLMAMSELQKLNKNKNSASRSMCLFLIINMSSVQIISVNILAYRTQYNSLSPAEIIAPGLIASLAATVVGIVVAKLCERWYTQ